MDARRFLAALLLALGSLAAHAAPPYKYYLLAPEQLSADLTVMSLEPGNTVTIGTRVIVLGEYQRAVIPAAELMPGRILSGTARYTIGSDGNATDLLAPDFFAGTAFVIPHITGDHKYYVQATTTTANLTINVGGTPDTLQIAPGTAYEIDAGSDNGIAGRIDSDQPIVVVHVAYVSGVARDAYPVPPASTELVGIRSQSAVIGANTNGTSVTVYTSDATSTSYSLNAGEKVAIAIGSSGAQGAGAAIHLTSNHPVAAVQYGDGDGDDATAFWPASALSRRHGIPVNAQYVAVACLQSASVTLFKGNTTPDTQSCSASGSDPGKVYFGSSTSGNNVSAGWHLTSSEPVFAIYEASAVEDEHNLSGAQTAAGPAAPTLAAISSPTTSNPLAISGTAVASTTVRLFVNGIHQQTTTSTGGGAYSFNAELFDGNNVIHVVAVNGSGDESGASNVEQVTYNNTVSRTQSGSLSGNHVWTPGSPATPYVISATLTIAAGAKLVLQPGTTLQFANGTSLTATGTLKIAGTAANPVTLTSSAASPTRGIWTGVVLNSTAAGSEISGAFIEWAVTGVNVNGVAASVRNSTIRNFSTRAVLVTGTGANATSIHGNLLDNLTDVGSCIEVLSNSTPSITANTITNCVNGILVQSGASPSVTGNNVITGNDNGINVAGGNNTNPAPVVTGNQIHTNDNFNYTASGFTTSGWTLLLNATGNWWGTTDTTLLANKIRDFNDDWSTSTGTRFPFVNYSGFVDGPQGATVPGVQLLGPLAPASTTLTAGATYQVLGILQVPTGKSLTVPAGTILRFHANGFIMVDGTLTIQGTSGTPVILTSAKDVPARGDWRGLYFRGSHGSLVEYADIQWTGNGIHASNFSATVRNSTIKNFSGIGVYVTGSGAGGTLIQGNLIDNLNDAGSCIAIETNPSPTITGNTLTNCINGIYQENTSSPVITNNVITGNDFGIHTYGANATRPNPIFTGNQIFDNDTYNVQTNNHQNGNTQTLNGTGNWWGTTDPAAIAAKILDINDSWNSTARPHVDIRGFLDGPNGSPVPGNQIGGILAPASTTLTAGTTYEVLGVLFVPAGKSLTVPAGATLRFHFDGFIVVDGTLNIQGTSGNLVTMIPASPTPTRGSWRGVYARAGSSLIEYADIQWAGTAINADNVSITVRNSTIRNFASHGVYIHGASAGGTLVENNVIDNLDDTGNCIFIEMNPSPTITGNTITNCNNGIYQENTSNPVITNNLITGNNFGIATDGANATNPNPIVTGNRIFDNDSYNLYTELHDGGYTRVINATGNWWGSTDPTVIAAKIRDISDNWTATNIPTVDFRGFLDGPGGSPVPGNFLMGPWLTTPASLTANTTYDVIGVLFVQAGKTLTIPQGVVLRFHNNHLLVVDGVLNVQGVSGNLVTLTSGKATPARADWRGVFMRAGGSVIDYAQIEWTGTAINVDGVSITVRNSVIRNFTSHGIFIQDPAAGGTLVQANLIDNLDDTGNCITIDLNPGPTISGNTLTNCNNGVYQENSSSPTITGNLITGNNYGINTNGANATRPNPIVTGNQIFGNATYNFHTASHNDGNTQTINATGNWWGTTNPAAIAATIRDLNDSWTVTTLPTVNFRGFLDGPGGSPVAGNQLLGIFPGASETLTSGVTYDVLGVTWVSAGKSLTIQSGATLRFHPGSFLVIDGTLQVQGTASNRVRFLPTTATPANGSWHGIIVRTGATGVVIDNALIEWATVAVDVRTANATVSNSIIRNFSSAGISMSGSNNTSQILNNFIDNLTKVGDGITLSASSPVITGNRIYRTNRAIFMSGNSTPAVSGNILTGNNWGIFLDGNNSNSATAVPRPVITGNDIFGNTTAQLEVFDYGTTSPVVINATGNWWGTPTPVAGTHIKFTSGSPVTTANFSSPATAPLNGVASGTITLSEMYFSPNGDSIKDTTAIAGTLSQASNWTITIKTPAGATVRTFTGSGTAISEVWDGQDGSGTPQPEGNYDCEVTIPGPIVVGFCSMALDVTPPVNVVTSPPPSSTIHNGLSVPVTGSASDMHIVSYTLEYGAGSTPSTWTTIQTQNASVTNALLGTWVVNNTSGGSSVPAGPYTLRLSTSDRAGNAVVATVPVTLDIIGISGVTQNLELIRPMLGQQLQIGFTLTAPATAYLRIHPEQGGALVKEVSQVFATGGAKTLSWDGRNTAGAYVPDEAYAFSLFVDDGVRTATYALPDADDVGSGSGSVDGSYNATRNDFWKMNYTLTAPKGRVRMQVTGCGVTGTHMVYDWVPFLPGTFLTMWDGRNQNGNLASGTCDIYFDAPDPLSPASVIVKGNKPTITGTGVSPNIEVKSNPYRATHSFDQISRITYRVDQDSYVTVKLLPPGISDPASPQAIVLENNVLKSALSGGSPANHEVEWRGYDPGDTNDILVSGEGVYTFTIQATGAVSGQTALYRGALQLYQ